MKNFNIYKFSFAWLVIFMAGTMFSQAQTFVNNGADITIGTGGDLFINGDFVNLDDGSIDNNWIIYIKGNWLNHASSGNLLQGSSGHVSFNGYLPQLIGGTTKTWFNNINLYSDVSLAVNTSLAGELTLYSNSLILSNSSLILENTASIEGVENSAYIIAEGNGRLVQTVGSSNVYFPVGTSTSFVPVILNNSGTVDNFGVKVFEDVLEDGTNGNTISEIDNCVNMSWDITEQTVGGSDLSITPFWTSANEGLLFDRSGSGVGQYTGGGWNPQAAQDGSGTSPFSITRSGISEGSTFAVGDMASPMVITLDIIVDLEILLEGPYSNGSMKTSLNSNNLLPLNQPYSQGPWNYIGTESVAVIPNSFVVDWVLIELRDAPSAAMADETTNVARQAGFLLSNGTVVSVDGTSSMQFNTAISNDLFLVVYHRNHIGVMSSNPLPQTDGYYIYDFTTSAYKAYGISDPQKEIATGVFGMYGGDINSNGIVEASDHTAWKVVTGTAGYQSSDANIDGQVDNQDKNDITILNIGAQSYIPE